VSLRRHPRADKPLRKVTSGYALGRERRARQWHARGQGFKSPQLHPRSTALPAVDRSQIARPGQQIGSNRRCLGRSVAHRSVTPAVPAGVVSWSDRPDEGCLNSATASEVVRLPCSTCPATEQSWNWLSHGMPGQLAMQVLPRAESRNISSRTTWALLAGLEKTCRCGLELTRTGVRIAKRASIMPHRAAAGWQQDAKHDISHYRWLRCCYEFS
jgi:hypothetical protein